LLYPRTDQSRKRGILETDLLLSTFADVYLPKMTREQMTDYDLFLDENDWDIYYWATQEEPSASDATADSPSSSSSSSSANTKTTDTSSASYGGSVEAELAEAACNTPASATSSSSTTCTGGSPLTGEHMDTKSAAAPALASDKSSPSSVPPPTSSSSGEWAQTVGTFKPAYRPVPERWQDSEILVLLREHVRSRSGQKGGMAFMPALKVE
jgi:succinate dehydrogenase assembly factor 2